jgi:co-chaperonin GroES (HSP10)
MTKSTLNPSKIRPYGPWVLLQVDAFEEKTASGLYRPQGNLEDRLGNSTATVIGVGQGFFNKGKRAKDKFTHSGLKEGDKVLFRGFLKDANRPYFDDNNCCLVHATDVIGIIED